MTESDLTLLLGRAAEGDERAEQDLSSALYAELHRLARCFASRAMRSVLVDHARKRRWDRSPPTWCGWWSCAYGGLTMLEVARTLGASLTAVERDWRLARIWLREALGDGARGC